MSIEDQLVQQWRETGNFDLGKMLLSIELDSDELTEEYSEKLDWLRDDFAEKRGGLEGKPKKIAKDLFNYLQGAERWFNYGTAGFIAGGMFGLIPLTLSKICAVALLIPHRYSLNGKLSKAIDNQIKRVKTKNPFKRVGHCKSLTYLYNCLGDRCDLDMSFKLAPIHIYSCLNKNGKKKIIENTVPFGFGPMHYIFNGGILINLISKEWPKEHVVALEYMLRCRRKRNEGSFNSILQDSERALEFATKGPYVLKHKIVEIAKKNIVIAHHNKAIEYVIQGEEKIDAQDWKGGISDLKEAIKIDPENKKYLANAYYNLGVNCFNSTDYKRAALFFEKAFKTFPEKKYKQDYEDAIKLQKK